uniref:Mobile element protein n=1 Tax=Escherichia coli TaxID=562 RepID=A0A2S1JE04_ECOLX|nr:hypothetical protein [Escherichia coli]AWF76564.1 Mobile element protein [Escherichia coli]
MGSCAAPSAKGDDKFITTDYLQQCRHAQPPFRSSRLIGAERQPTSDCRQSLQQSPPC